MGKFKNGYPYVRCLGVCEIFNNPEIIPNCPVKILYKFLEIVLKTKLVVNTKLCRYLSEKAENVFLFTNISVAPTIPTSYN